MLRGPVIPISVLRWRARAPRVALIACCSILSLAGLRAVLDHGDGVQVARAPSTSVDGSLDGFAEGLARAYVASPSSDASIRERSLKAYGFGETASTPVSVGGIRVRWSAVVASQALARRGRLVTVLL